MEDAVLLARAQFGLNIAFHILFPTLSIGLAWVLVFLKTRAHFCTNPFYEEFSSFLIKVFAITFALGAASGIIMSFQFGTNWPGFMNTVGAVAGPLLSFEILSAFFLEATFLGILLFGKNKVPTWVITLSAWIVALGTTLSAFWILSLNSWMHTPAGIVFDNGILKVTDWHAVIFNPSFPYRFAHMMTACLVTAAFFCLGLFAYKFIKTKDIVWTKLIKKTAPYALVLSLTQAVIGDLHGLNTLEYQPAKVAAMEGLWETKKGAPLLLFALPNQAEGKNYFELGVPNLASLILTHKLDGELKGLNDFEIKPDKVGIIFWSFRVMVGVGIFLILISAYFSFKKISEKPKLEHRLLSLTMFAGWIAVLSGWLVTEIGRQPWLVTGILKTKDAVGQVSLEAIQISFISYAVLYALCLMGYLFAIFHLSSKFNFKGRSS